MEFTSESTQGALFVCVEADCAQSSRENSTEIDRLGRTGICCDRMTCVAPTRPVVRVVAIRRLDRSATIRPDTLIPAQALLLVAREATGKSTRRGRRPWRWIAGSPRPLADSSNTAWLERPARSTVRGLGLHFVQACGTTSSSPTRANRNGERGFGTFPRNGR